MKLLLILVLGLLFTVVTALFGTLFFLAGWNWGVAPAFGLREIGLGTAFWLSLAIASIGNTFKSSLTVGKDD